MPDLLKTLELNGVTSCDCEEGRRWSDNRPNRNIPKPCTKCLPVSLTVECETCGGQGFASCRTFADGTCTHNECSSCDGTGRGTLTVRVRREFISPITSGKRGFLVWPVGLPVEQVEP